MPKNAEEMFIEMLMEGMLKGGKSTKRPVALNKEAVNELAKKKNNKVLFDAHIKAGFTAEQSMQIITAIINKL